MLLTFIFSYKEMTKIPLHLTEVSKKLDINNELQYFTKFSWLKITIKNSGVLAHMPKSLGHVFANFPTGFPRKFR